VDQESRIWFGKLKLLVCLFVEKGRPIMNDHRPWAKLSELKPGDLLIAAQDLSCIDEGDILEVKLSKTNGLYVVCACGKHDLSDHLCGDFLLGFHKTSWNMRDA
jgi:hypothetical protein